MRLFRHFQFYAVLNVTKCDIGGSRIGVEILELRLYVLYLIWRRTRRTVDGNMMGGKLSMNGNSHTICCPFCFILYSEMIILMNMNMLRIKNHIIESRYFYHGSNKVPRMWSEYRFGNRLL